jgi:hypothetical protein
MSIIQYSTIRFEELKTTSINLYQDTRRLDRDLNRVPLEGSLVPTTDCSVTSDVGRPSSR